jgi:hypothetical protein
MIRESGVGRHGRNVCGTGPVIIVRHRAQDKGQSGKGKGQRQTNCQYDFHGVGFSSGARRGWPRKWLRARAGPHPVPRPGITAARCRQYGAGPPERGTGLDQRRFRRRRRYPRHCGCAEAPDSYSLLSCYEGRRPWRNIAPSPGRGRWPSGCRGGEDLDEIRAPSMRNRRLTMPTRFPSGRRPVSLPSRRRADPIE